MKSEDEEEELAMADRQAEGVEEGDEEEEVDEEELEAFLDGQLADGLPFLQEGSNQGGEHQEINTLCVPPSKAEGALRTCKLPVKGSVHPNNTKDCRTHT